MKVSCSSSHNNLNTKTRSSPEVRGLPLGRRGVIASPAILIAPQIFSPKEVLAVQGGVPGRAGGLDKSQDENGYMTYMRPEEKSGGHGIGWTEIPRYSFKVPAGWTEKSVSIADPGGTEIDLRYLNKAQGSLFVVVAPIQRFREIPFNADIRVEEIGDPYYIMDGFAPELFKHPLEEFEYKEVNVEQHDGLTYYHYLLDPYNLCALTSVGNRVFILVVQANKQQWRSNEQMLRGITDSFTVPIPEIIQMEDEQSGVKVIL